MYALRLGEVLPHRDLDTLRGIEGSRVKATYRLMAEKFGIEMVDSAYFFTEKRLNQLREIQGQEKTQLDHTAYLIKNELIDPKKRKPTKFPRSVI